ncbi:hypothetical protein C2845_PM03G13700 [Panicum miliaceum]|uniref:Uncharacterized protein n=1 Tax=Panicum miliaceum TaxID=4540 RepID=A0A3L6TAJ8_PANMI|nr:hypothetical protein C2845_PM03G13700 [Panicum miliaceum]
MAPREAVEIFMRMTLPPDRFATATSPFLVNHECWSDMALLVNYSGPLQLNEGDIPILWHDIRGRVQGLRQTWRTLQHRDRIISPFLVNNIPVTPYANATTKMTSNHVIRLWDSEAPPNLEYCYIVDLLMRDDDLYSAAFRRGKLTIEQLEALRAGGGDRRWLGR